MKKQRNTVQVIRIDSVDVPGNQVHCVSKDGGRFAIKIPIANGFYRIPRVGENWIVRREDFTNWYFEGIVVNDQDPYGSTHPQEGDIVVNAESNINLYGKAMYFNNEPVGIWENEEFDLDAATDSITLAETPIPNVIQVFNNGLLIAPSVIIIRERTLLFDNPLSAGIVVVYYMKLPQQ